jgi:hypothetical protein
MARIWFAFSSHRTVLLVDLRLSKWNGGCFSALHTVSDES